MIAASFWPVVAVIAAVVLIVIGLRRAWQTNFAGIRDIVLGTWNRVSLVFQGIRALIESLSGGAGQMSAELADTLQAAGLMGFVTRVFQVYFRIRQFLTGLWESFSSVFGRVRTILEPVVKTLVGAFAELGKALLSVFSAFGTAATAADASSFKNVGVVLGGALGVVLQLGAYILKFVIYPLVFVIRTVALVVKTVVWLGRTIVGAFVSATPVVYKFYLPLRMLVQGLLMVGRVAWSVWQILTGQVSVVDGLRAIGGAVYQFLAKPFLWVRDVVSSVWAGIRTGASMMTGTLRSLFGSIGGSASSAWSSVRGAAAAAFASIVAGLRSPVTDAFQSGRSIMTAVASGN